jgi:7 transmembrane receptor (Secretin family)
VATSPANSGTSSCSFVAYSCYAWGVPLLIVMLAVLADLLPVDIQLIDAYRPLYGRRFCWIGSCTALVAYFAAPMGALWIANVVMYAASARQIYVASAAARPAAQTSTTGSAGLLVSKPVNINFVSVTIRIKIHTRRFKMINQVTRPIFKRIHARIMYFNRTACRGQRSSLLPMLTHAEFV